MTLGSELTTQLKRAIKRHQVPGASLAVLRNNRITATAVAGVTNLDTRVAVTPDTVFQIGSITKPFTATLVMQLVDEGKLALDAPIQRYLPNFRVADLDVSRAVTIRDFLSHQSGIDGDFFVDSGRGDDAIARLVDMATMVPSLFPRGEKLSYCNLGFAVLGRVIEVVTAKTWDAALKERIFDRLGMDHAFSLPEMALRFNCALGHVPSQRKRGTWYASRIPYLSLGQKAAGATPTMSASDLLRFAQMHLNKGKNQHGERVLSSASIAAMQRRQMDVPKNSPHFLNAWGLGWMLFDWQGEKLFGHDGATIGQNAYLRIHPGKQVAFALLTNGGDTPALFMEMAESIFHRVARVTFPPAPLDDPDCKVDMERLSGTYANLNQKLVLQAKAGALTVSALPNGGGTPAFPAESALVFIDKDTARLHTGDTMRDRLTFLFSDYRGGKAGYVAHGLRQYKRV